MALPKNFRMIENRLLVREHREEKTKSGLFLPEIEDPEYILCEVLAVGPGRLDMATEKIIPMTAKVGDFVQLQHKLYQRINLGDEKGLIAVREGDICWLFEGGKPDYGEA